MRGGVNVSSRATRSQHTHACIYSCSSPRNSCLSLDPERTTRKMNESRVTSHHPHAWQTDGLQRMEVDLVHRSLVPRQTVHQLLRVVVPHVDHAAGILSDRCLKRGKHMSTDRSQEPAPMCRPSGVHATCT